jgi:hypothetical protein
MAGSRGPALATQREVLHGSSLIACGAFFSIPPWLPLCPLTSAFLRVSVVT